MRHLSFSFLTALAIVAGDVSLLSSAAAQTSVATVPVGFTQQVITPAVNASTPSSTVISVPFYNAAAYAAAVSTVDSSTTFSISTAAWTSGQYAQVAAPYLVHMKSGASTGRYFLIQSNTATQVTVFPRGYDLTTTIGVGDTFEVVPANTVGILFGKGTVPFVTNTDVNQADNLYLWNGSTFLIYFHNGTNWRRSGSLSNQNDTVLYPDEGIFILRRSTAPLSLTFVGTVPSTTERSDVFGPGSTFLSNRFPTDTTLLNLGLQNLPNWVTGTDPNAVDNVYIWNGSTWLIYFYNGTNWKRSGSLSSFNTLPITSGSAVFVVRRSTGSGNTAALTQNLPYSL